MNITAVDATIIVALIGFAGIIYNAWNTKRETPEARQSRLADERRKLENDTIDRYRNLVKDIQARYDEIEQENNDLKKQIKEDSDAHGIHVRNQEAIAAKREIDFHDELKRIRSELRSYQVGYTEMRRIARRYAPPDVRLPEVNGSTTPDYKGEK